MVEPGENEAEAGDPLPKNNNIIVPANNVVTNSSTTALIAATDSHHFVENHKQDVARSDNETQPATPNSTNPGTPVQDFPFSQGLTGAEAAELLAKYGRNELVEKTTPSWLIYLHGLSGPMPLAIWIAVIIEFGLENWPDGAILLAILFANATISWYETTKAGNAVAALKNSLKPTALVFRDKNWVSIDAALLVPGDLVKLGAGAAVPADCVLHDCQIEVDESALTGESLPVQMGRLSRPKMGGTVVRGEGEATVEYTGSETFFGRTAALLSSVGNELGSVQKLLVSVMIILTTLSFALCVAALIYLIVAIDESVKRTLDFTVVLLVASIPIAIEIVVTTTLALGSRELAGFKAIVTRLQSIEALAGMNMLCSDKTGTLTLNKMEVQEECPTFVPGFNKRKTIMYAALAAKWKEPPRDALDTMVLGSSDFDLEACNAYEQLDYLPFDPTLKRTESTLRGPNGKLFKVTKGAPNVIFKLLKNKTVKLEAEAMVHSFAVKGTRCLAVARTTNDSEPWKWELVGILTFLDPPRPDTQKTIEQARKLGVHVKMITGDHAAIAKEMGKNIGLGSNILSVEKLPNVDLKKPLPKTLGEEFGPMILNADGFAQVFPEHKFLIVEALRQYGFVCGMTGDGVNDSPALKRADIGIAVSGATDAARAAAAIVLTAPGLSVIIEAITIARSVFNRIKAFMTYRIGATLQLLCFFFIAVFALPPDYYQPPEAKEVWPKFFSVPVLMLMLITLLNDGTLLTIGYDRVLPSKVPQKWNLPVLFLISTVLAAVACVSSLLLLWGALDSYNPNGWFASWGLPPMEYPKIVALVYMKVSISDFLTLFAARTLEQFSWSSRPANVLVFGAFCALLSSTMIGSFFPDTTLSGVRIKGLATGDGYSLWPLWLWLYCLVWWLLQDLAKVATYRLLDRYDIFKYRSLAAGMIYKENLDNDGHSVRVQVKDGPVAAGDGNIQQAGTSAENAVCLPMAPLEQPSAAAPSSNLSTELVPIPTYANNPGLIRLENTFGQTKYVDSYV